MSRPASRTTRPLARWGAGVALSLATTLGALTAPAPAQADNVVTPGNFTGYGFDQCLAPTQSAMTTWLNSSPFLAVGIYISGYSRGCRSQPNLTPTWVTTQLEAGWRLLPITLGPQASCSTRYPRYGSDKTIDPARGSTGTYPNARVMGRDEATKTVGQADRLGISAGSTLWYDIEAFDISRTDCRESALAFLSAWTRKLHGLGYRSGVYSSAASGIKMLDDARVNRPKAFHLPDQIWLARWDGVANTSSSYVRTDGWQPHARVKQYQGGHDETWGGVRINIDRNYLDVGKGSYAAPEKHCGVRLSFPDYPRIRPATADQTPDPLLVKALQCRLQEEGLYAGPVDGAYSPATIAAARKWQAAHGFTTRPVWYRRHWVTLLSPGPTPVLKTGSAGRAVRRVQRSLNADSATAQLAVTGIYSSATVAAVRDWQDRHARMVTGIMTAGDWAKLQSGRL